jgi:hypothetical protein
MHTQITTVFCLAIALLFVPSCTGDVANRVVGDATVFVNGARLSIESAETGAIVVYRDQQLKAVMAVAEKNGTRATAEAEVAKIRAAWEPVWQAFVVARSAHAALHAAIVAYEQGAPILIGSERREPTLGDIARLSSELARAHTKLTELLKLMRESAGWDSK